MANVNVTLMENKQNNLVVLEDHNNMLGNLIAEIQANDETIILVEYLDGTDSYKLRYYRYASKASDGRYYIRTPDHYAEIGNGGAGISQYTDETIQKLAAKIGELALEENGD